MHPRWRAIEAPSGFRWRHSHAAEKGMQGNLDAGREMRDHCGAIQRNDLAAAIGIIIGQETPTGAKAVARKRHIYIDLENLDLEHVSGPSDARMAPTDCFQTSSVLTPGSEQEPRDFDLRDQPSRDEAFQEIMGDSAPLREVLRQVRTVAATDATVLLLGETGTGKELVARALHRLSPRAGSNFISVNCTAIPTELLERELFGHEKGAFSGAINRYIGRLELADQGTMLLDEVGDLPTTIQPKLLRVLQDKEFERLCSNRTGKVDVRLIAATNHDLHQSIAEGRFRQDLFYRLNVFPIYVPPLRARKSDIPALVRHFVSRYASECKKPIDTIPAEAMNALVNWDWPRNIRELQNFVQRCVILTDSPVLRVPVGELK